MATKNERCLRKNGVRTKDLFSSMSAQSVSHTTKVFKLTTTSIQTKTCSQHRERPPDTKIKSWWKMTPFKSPPASNNDSYKNNNLANNVTVIATAEKECSLELITTPILQESRSSIKTKKTSQTQQQPIQQALQRRYSVDQSSSNQSTGSKFKSIGAAIPICKPSVTVDAHVEKFTIQSYHKPPYSSLASLRRASQPRQKANTNHGRWSLMPQMILRHILSPHHHSPSDSVLTPMREMPRCKRNSSSTSIKTQRTKFRLLPTLGATSFITLLTLICLETVLLSTMSTCAKTFYMHWNTSNSIFRIDNTDHIIDVNKGNLAFEFDQVHIICPVYEPGTYENETEKYIIYNVSKVEYETCRITNADPRVIAICDKPQKLMFFTITFRPFTPQPGGLEFLPGNDYYFISTSSKDDLYRRIGGRCSTNNMKVVFKVCCAPEEKNKTAPPTTAISAGAGSSGGIGTSESGTDENTAGNIDTSTNINQGGHHMNNINNIGINGVNPAMMPGPNGGGGVQLKPISGMGTSINSNIDQFNRIPIQPNVMGGNFVGGAPGVGGSGIMLSPGHMLPPNRGGSVSIGQYPGHHHVQTGIRINNVPTQQYYPPHKGSVSNDDHHYNKHPNEVVKNEELTYNSAAASTILKQHAISWKQLMKFITLSSSLTTYSKVTQEQHMLDEATVDPTNHYLCYKCSELMVKLIVFIRNLFMSIHPLIFLPILAKVLIDCMCKYTLRKGATHHHSRHSNAHTRFALGLSTDSQTVCQTDAGCR